MPRLVLVVALALGLASPLAAAPPASPLPGGPRVRPTDARAARVLREGLLRSPTFGALVDRLERGGVIVYVSMDPRMRHGLAGGIAWVTTAGTLRCVRVTLNPLLRTTALVAGLGHELRHAVEVDDHPAIDGADAFLDLYEAIGHTGGLGAGSWDTPAAVAAGEVILAEAAAAGEAAGPRGRFGPGDWHAWYRGSRAGDADSIQGPQ
ncbi:MAG: hypothetical protein AB7H88_13095 [Vicinamibacterales bacterium]